MKLNTTLLSPFLILLLASVASGKTPMPMCNLRAAMGAYGYSCSGAFQGLPFAAYGYVFGDGRGPVAWLWESQLEWQPDPSVDACHKGGRSRHGEPGLHRVGDLRGDRRWPVGPRCPFRLRNCGQWSRSQRLPGGCGLRRELPVDPGEEIGRPPRLVLRGGGLSIDFILCSDSMLP